MKKKELPTFSLGNFESNRATDWQNQAYHMIPKMPKFVYNIYDLFLKSILFLFHKVLTFTKSGCQSYMIQAVKKVCFCGICRSGSSIRYFENHVSYFVQNRRK